MPVRDIIRKNYIKVDINDYISKVIGKLTPEQPNAFVFDKKRFVGVVDYRKFIRLRMDPSKTKIRKVTTKVPKLNLSTSITETARLLETADTHALPVLKSGQVVGIVYFFDALKQLKSNPKIGKIQISEIMKKLITLNENEPLSKALNILKQKHISRIPIVDDANKLLGILSEFDLIMNYFSFPPYKTGRAGGEPGFKTHPAKERDTTRLPVKNPMTKVVFTLTKENTVKEALEIMAKNKVASIVIVDGEIPVGIITAKDIFRIISA